MSFTTVDDEYSDNYGRSSGDVINNVVDHYHYYSENISTVTSDEVHPPRVPPPSKCSDEVRSTSSSSSDSSGIIMQTRSKNTIPLAPTQPKDIEDTMVLTDAAINNYRGIYQGFNDRLATQRAAHAATVTTTPAPDAATRPDTPAGLPITKTLRRTPRVNRLARSLDTVSEAGGHTLASKNKWFSHSSEVRRPAYWVVFVGFTPGIYLAFKDAEGAAAGFDGARIAVFATYDDAQRVWMTAFYRGQILGLF